MRGEKKRPRSGEVNRNEVSTNHIRSITRRRRFCKARRYFLYGTFGIALLVFMMSCMTEDIGICLKMAIPSLGYMVLFTLINYKSDKHWG